MHVLVDALSVNNLSGRHVLLGHLHELAGSGGKCRFTLLSSMANDDSFSRLPAGVARHRAPVGAGWVQRVAWQRCRGAALCRDLAVDAVFSPSGMLSTGMPRPQVVLAQNPWPMVAELPLGRERMKLSLQRYAFAVAQRNAAVMAFNSRYMQDLYAQRFGTRRKPAIVAHQGIAPALFDDGAHAVGAGNREPLVLCVSVMARHKAIEVLVDAFGLLAARIPLARLCLVGSWPDPQYRGEIEQRIASAGLAARVEVRGHVDAAELHRLYASAKAFCLLSRCESFGIPAIEAQAFGTPAVVAAGTAAPEIIGSGGEVVAKDDAEAAAAALSALLGDDASWPSRSRAARANAERFHWQACSAPLVEVFEAMARTHG